MGDGGRLSQEGSDLQPFVDRLAAGPGCCRQFTGELDGLLVAVDNDVRATVHSFLSQAENLGEVILGIALAFIAGSASSRVALTVSAALLACAGAVVSRARE